MGSLAEPRYCANGDRCAWSAQDGKPGKLRRSSEFQVCERCRGEGISTDNFRTPPIDPSQTREPFLDFLRSTGKDVLKSDEGERMVKFKRGLVLGHFLRRGDFWNEIKAMRRRWNITAIPGFPPTPTWYPHPFPDPTDERERSKRDDFDKELYELEQRVVPERFRQGFFCDWDRFIAFCILHDPPDDGLIEFAEQGGPYPMAVWNSDDVWNEDDSLGDRPRGNLLMVAPPVKWLRDPHEERLAQW